MVVGHCVHMSVRSTRIKKGTIVKLYSPLTSWCGFLLLSLLLAAPFAAAKAESQERYGQLADLLEDEDSRGALIQDLRRLADGEDRTTAATEEQAETGALPQRIADATQQMAEATVSELGDALSALRSLDLRGEEQDLAALGAATLDLLLVIVATVAAFLVLRRLARGLFSRANRWALQPGAMPPILRRTIAVLGAALVDLAVVVLAWVIGYVLALAFIGEAGAMESRHSLFLNAFLLIEVFKAAIRVLFASRDEGLRLLPLPGEEAAYWNAWLARLASFIGYGLMLVVPLINMNLSPALGRGVGLLIMLGAFLYALAIILQNRPRVRGQLEAAAANSGMAFTRFLISGLARTWHVIAIAYFGALAVVSITRPEDALPFMAQATVQSVVAILVGFMVSATLSQIIGRRIQVPEETRLKFPLLEARLNSYIPTSLKLMRLLILLIVIGVVADAWGIFDLAEWIVSDAGTSTIGTIISLILILGLTLAAWLLFASWIEHRLNPQAGHGEPGPREKTLLTIFRNAVAIVLVVMTTMIVLAEIGINIGPLIAGAGVLGLAIGFGAQKLVEDVINGLFIQLENAISVGDIVTVAGVTGEVEKLTIRSISIRDLSGTFHIIPFSSVNSVSNYMREFAYHLGVYGVAYRENVDEVITVLREAFEELMSDDEARQGVLSDELEVHGLTEFADSSVNVRVRIKTLPGLQWAIGRAYNRLVKQHFDAAGIEIPFPHTTLYFGEDKDGSAPSANVKLLKGKTRNGKRDEPDAPSAVPPEEARPNPTYKGDYDGADD